MTATTKLAIVATHPIQHFVPLYRALAATDGIDLRVLYGSRMGLHSYFDAEMNRTVAWNMDLLSGYASEFLTAAAEAAGPVGTGIPKGVLRKALLGFAPDAIIIYGYATPLARGAARIARSRNARTMMISDSELRQERGLAKRAIKSVVVPFLLNRFDAMLSVGDENERYYRHYGVAPDRIFRSPFPIDEAAFKAVRPARGRHRRALLDRLGLTGDPLLALFVGKLSSRKRPGDLVEAIARTKHHPRPVHAVFAGDGALFDELKQRATKSGHSHLLGFINVDELPSLYAACDVLAHPSATDPHPLICSEAACVGLPMILSDRVGAEGPTDIAQEGRNALVYPVGDVAALADRLVALAEDPELVEKMGRESLAIFDTLDMTRSVAGIRAALERSSTARD